MPKSLLKKWLPSNDTVKNHKHLARFEKILTSPNLWHINRKSVARATAIGLFMAFMPVPFQMILACVAAIMFNANVLIAVLLVWISNPITIPPIFYAAYKFGSLIITYTPPKLLESDGWMAWMQQVDDLMLPLMIGLFSFAAFFSVLGFIFVHLVWRINVGMRWKKRKSQNKTKAV